MIVNCALCVTLELRLFNFSMPPTCYSMNRRNFVVTAARVARRRVVVAPVIASPHSSEITQDAGRAPQKARSRSPGLEIEAPRSILELYRLPS